jgi:hypothetical protein
MPGEYIVQANVLDFDGGQDAPAAQIQPNLGFGELHRARVTIRMGVVVHGCERRGKVIFGARVSKAVVQKFTVFKNSPVIQGGTDDAPLEL